MISWERVNELREEIGEEDFAEVAEMFIEEVESIISRLKVDVNPESLEEDMHALKGSALNLGFQGLADLCQHGEKLAAARNFSAIPLESVFTTYAESKVEFSRALSPAQHGAQTR